MVLRCENSLLSDILDHFGLDTILCDNGDNTFDATVTAEPRGGTFWAMQYLERCEILHPLWLRQELAHTLFEGWERYRSPSAFQKSTHSRQKEKSKDEG